MLKRLFANRYAWLFGALEIAIGVSLALALVAALTGRAGIRVGPWTLPVREVWRPLVIAALLSAGRLVITRLRLTDSARSGVTRLTAVARVAIACGIVAAVLLWTHYQVRDCGGADSYGYVSAAHAMLSGDLIAPQPIVKWLPFADAISAATPFGWTPRPSGDAIVPFYPLGFPLAMAGAIMVAGPGAGFYVPLLAGIGILVITYRLTRQLAGSLVAGVTTVVVAFNPMLTNMVIQPMSDVPATFWYLAAVAGILTAPSRPALSGIAFGMAVWTRPLMLVGAPALLWVMPRDRRTLVRWFSGVVPVGGGIALVQWWLYGSPFRTGYGSAAGLFTTTNLLANAMAYAKWILVIHSPLFLAALAAGAWRAPRRLVIVALAGLLLGVTPYLFKLAYFDDWDLVRYVLPVLIPCVIMAAIGVASALEGAMPRLAFVSVLLLATAAVSGASYQFVANRATFSLRFQESRYPAVAAWVTEHTPPGAVILAEGHVGSLRFYAHRTTLRIDQLPAGALAETVRNLAGGGMECYAAVDGAAESQDFEQRLSREQGHVIAEPVGRVRETTILRLRQKP